MSKFKKMEELLGKLKAGEKKAKPKKEKKKEVKGDVNKDGKVDEKDLSIVHKAYEAEKKKEKKIVKKK